MTSREKSVLILLFSRSTERMVHLVWSNRRYEWNTLMEREEVVIDAPLMTCCAYRGYSIIRTHNIRTHTGPLLPRSGLPIQRAAHSRLK